MYIVKPVMIKLGIQYFYTKEDSYIDFYGIYKSEKDMASKWIAAFHSKKQANEHKDRLNKETAHISIG